VKVGLSQSVGKVFQTALTKILSNFHSKFEMPPIMKNMFLEKRYNFHIGIILSV
jgi:hypothetical protein